MKEIWTFGLATSETFKHSFFQLTEDLSSDSHHPFYFD